MDSWSRENRIILVVKKEGTRLPQFIWNTSHRCISEHLLFYRGLLLVNVEEPLESGACPVKIRHKGGALKGCGWSPGSSCYLLPSLMWHEALPPPGAPPFFPTPRWIETLQNSELQEILPALRCSDRCVYQCHSRVTNASEGERQQNLVFPSLG